MGALLALLEASELEELRDVLNIDPNTTALVLSTEGMTDPDNRDNLLAGGTLQISR